MSHFSIHSWLLKGSDLHGPDASRHSCSEFILSESLDSNLFSIACNFSNLIQEQDVWRVMNAYRELSLLTIYCLDGWYLRIFQKSSISSSSEKVPLKCYNFRTWCIVWDSFHLSNTSKQLRACIPLSSLSWRLQIPLICTHQLEKKIDHDHYKYAYC